MEVEEEGIKQSLVTSELLPIPPYHTLKRQNCL